MYGSRVEANCFYSVDMVIASNMFKLDKMWHMIVPPACDDTGDVASSALPQRPDVPDCLYYVRTGMCNYGINCRFNHPQKRKLDKAFEKGDGYPERVGQPECQFYIKTGTCKFGSTCRYHHPREKAGILGKALVNGAGYPLRLGEKDCPYYVQNGTCKFGMLCKFNHPQPALSFPSWTLAREPYMQGLPLHSSCYTPLHGSPEGLISMHGTWNGYQGQMRPVVPILPSNMKQHTFGLMAIYGAASRGIHASYSPYMEGSAATALVHSNNSSKDSNFPERPGQPECKYYIKTGDCKFGASCHFDHPKRWTSLLPDCCLSSQGLPQRPGTQPCAYYMQYGTCKFGIACRYDHPTTSLTYSSFPKSIVNGPSFPDPQSFAVPRFSHSSIHTLGGANVQQCNKDNETALTEGQPSSDNAIESGELNNSPNGVELTAST